MISDDLPLSRAAVDRTAVARADDDLVRRARADRGTRVLLVRDGSVVTHAPADGGDVVGAEGWGRRAGAAVAVAYLDPETAEGVARAAAQALPTGSATGPGPLGEASSPALPARGPAAGGGAPSSDAGTTGTGSTHAGSTDAGSTDAGSTDAGSTDTGSTDADPGDGGWLFLGRDAAGDVLARRVRPQHAAPRSGAASDVLVHRPTTGSGPAAEAAIAASTDVANGAATSGPTGADAPRSEPLPGLRWTALRAVGAELSDVDAGLATTAVALDAWHARHPRCPRCGEPTVSTAAGWTRRCTADGSEHYPRTDPAVIMAVVDEADRLLLGHAAAWAPHRFSTLAGFVEAGESVEHAVRREVAEETTVQVGDVAYAGSQPWPFPASLMLGFRARALSTEVTVDGVELTEARWFSRDELAAAVATGELVLPSPASIAHALIADWYGGPVPTAG